MISWACQRIHLHKEALKWRERSIPKKTSKYLSLSGHHDGAKIIPTQSERTAFKKLGTVLSCSE